MVDYFLQNLHGEQKGLEIIWEETITHTVDSRYLEIDRTVINTSRYPYFDISDL